MRAVALFVLHLLHSTRYWYLCLIDQLREPLNEILICRKCQRMSNVMDLWYSLVSLIAMRERRIDNHIQAILKNSLVSLIVEISMIDL